MKESVHCHYRHLLITSVPCKMIVQLLISSCHEVNCRLEVSGLYSLQEKGEDCGIL